MSKITRKELHPSLLRLIENGSGGNGNTKSGNVKAYKNTVSISSDSSIVNIGIPNYDKFTDTLMVFVNSIYIEEDIEFTISSDSSAINNKNGSWSVVEGKTTDFNFVVLKNIPDTGSGQLQLLRNNTDVNTAVNTVNIGIVKYDKDVDSLMVFKNSVYLDDSEYRISSDSMTIVKNNGSWNETNQPTSFSFIVYKNIPLGEDGYLDGSKLKPNSVPLSKLSQDVIDKINAGGSSSGEVNQSKTFNITNSQWTLDSVSGLYKYTLSHGLNSDNLMLVALDSEGRLVILSYDTNDLNSLVLEIGSACNVKLHVTNLNAISIVEGGGVTIEDTSSIVDPVKTKAEEALAKANSHDSIISALQNEINGQRLKGIDVANSLLNILF